MSGVETKDICEDLTGSVTGKTLKERLLCSPDLCRDFTWAEIDCVRRIISIVFTSDSLDTETGDTNILTRTFTYEGSDPFDLDEICDDLVVS